MVDPGRFPNVVSALQEAGLDPTRERVPVAPASHYVMGGIVTDLDGRATGVSGSTPSASAPAPACTAPTGSRRTRSASASCSAAARRCAASTSRRRGTRTRLRRRADRGADAARPARRSGARGARAQRAGPRELARGPVPARPPGGRLRAGPPRDARLARPRRVPGARSRARRAPHDPRPRHRHPAVRGMALLIDWGGVLTTSMMGSFDAFAAARASTSAHGVPRRPGGPRAADRARDRRIDIAELRGAARRRASASTPRTSRSRLTQEVRPDHEMRDAVKTLHDRGVPTALVSNSWREDDYDGRRSLRRDRALSATRHPQARPADLRHRRRTARRRRRALRLRRRPRRQPQARKSPGYDHDSSHAASSTIAQLKRLLSPSNPS